MPSNGKTQPTDVIATSCCTIGIVDNSISGELLCGKEYQMEKDRFEFVSVEAEQGRDIFVRHPENGEEGRVKSCSGEQVTFEDPQGDAHIYDYRILEELSRSKGEWPRRN